MQSQIAAKELTNPYNTNVVIEFGFNEVGQCGPTCYKHDSPRSVPFLLSTVITSVSAGSCHSLTLSSAGRVHFGVGETRAAVGNVELGSHFGTPTLVESLNFIVCASAGGIHSGCLDDKYGCYMQRDLRTARPWHIGYPWNILPNFKAVLWWNACCSGFGGWDSVLLRPCRHWTNWIRGLLWHGFSYLPIAVCLYSKGRVSYSRGCIIDYH